MRTLHSGILKMLFAVAVASTLQACVDPVTPVVKPIDKLGVLNVQVDGQAITIHNAYVYAPAVDSLGWNIAAIGNGKEPGFSANFTGVALAAGESYVVDAGALWGETGLMGFGTLACVYWTDGSHTGTVSIDAVEGEWVTGHFDATLLGEVRDKDNPADCGTIEVACVGFRLPLLHKHPFERKTRLEKR